MRFINMEYFESSIITVVRLAIIDWSVVQNQILTHIRRANTVHHREKTEERLQSRCL